MTENKSYKVNPLEKIAQIEDPKVRELCKKTVEEAIKMTKEAASTQAISQRLSRTINVTVSNLVKED